MTRPSDEIRNEINRRLLESGELERLERELLQQLQEAGWHEELRRSCQRSLREPDPALRATSFQTLLEAVQPEAANIPDHVRQRILKQVAEAVRSMVEQVGEE